MIYSCMTHTKKLSLMISGDKCGYADLVKAGELGSEKAFEIIQIV